MLETLSRITPKHTLNIGMDMDHGTSILHHINILRKNRIWNWKILKMKNKDMDHSFERRKGTPKAQKYLKALDTRHNTRCAPR